MFGTAAVRMETPVHSLGPTSHAPRSALCPHASHSMLPAPCSSLYPLCSVLCTPSSISTHHLGGEGDCSSWTRRDVGLLVLGI